MVKIRKIKELQQDIELDLIIRDQMANLGCLLMCNFGNFLALALAAAHTADSLDIDDENEDYKSGLS